MMLPMDDPASSLQSAENALRLAVREVLGDDWQQYVSDVPRIEAKQAEEAKRRDGVTVESDLLAYTEFHELTGIIMKAWEKFQPVFDDKKRTQVWFDSLEDVRNAIAHSRTLVEYERYLIAGVAGQIRNQVSLFRTSEDATRKHYAIIESVRDSFGRLGYKDPILMIPDTSADPRLEIGDSISFDCVGSDVRGRELEWVLLWDQLSRSQNATVPIPPERTRMAYGNSVTLSLTIDEGDVGENLVAKIYVRAKDSKHVLHYRSMGTNERSLVGIGHDDYRRFDYSVNPPF